MMSNYNCLDLNIIKQDINKACFIKEARDFISDEDVDFNPLVIKHKIKETSEALKLLKDGFVCNFDGIENINDLLIKADKNIRLEGVEIKNILVFHNHCQRIKKLFDGIDLQLSIKDYSDSININTRVFDEIDKCIDNNGAIKDDATEDLKRINKELEQCEKDLYNKAYEFINRHASSLQEQAIYERNGRLTFLVKNSDKNKFQGYTYGSSASGLAFYVEPQVIVDLNNRKNELIQDKADEIERILTNLTYLISSISKSYMHNFDSLMKLCVIFSKASYGIKRNGIVAKLNDGEYFEFNDLCHPLIDGNKVVSNNYRLFAPYLGVVICGSNTGGKTVSLKAIGLSIIMTYLGIPIIASDASVPLYKNVYVDIDDNQSIVDSLSTFSAHISNINNILNNADENSLILIDELISGTDPKQAQAISLAILDSIKQKKSKFIITTHFDEIKKYSYDDEQILLSSVGFNMETLKPTYKYLENSIGSSNALEIASRYFDDQSIIENAKNYLSKNQSEQDILLDKLSKQLDQTEIIKQDLLNKQEIISKQEEELSNKLINFDREKEELKKKYLNELNDYVEHIKYKARNKLKEIKQNDNKVIKQLDELIEETPIKEEKVAFKVGDNVRINDNEQIGIISEINGDKASITIRGITVKAKLNDLKLMPKIKKQETKVVTKHYARVSNELNVVGARVEDGLVEVLDYLDRANAANMSQVKIIHGIGTGALRNAIREKLSKLSFVKSYGDGDFYDGGSAVTMVVFK